MTPKDIKSLLTWLTESNQLDGLLNNLITQWGPSGRKMLSSDFLPPRLVDKNEDTIEKVHFRTVAAVDGTRYSPAQMVDAGEMFGKIHYRLGHSDLARQITGPDYDGIVKYLNRKLGMEAAARVLGIFNTFIVQAMVEHDELANWEAIVKNSITRRGDNAYFEYEQGPTLAGHRSGTTGDWTDPNFDFWLEDIAPKINLLVSLGYDRGGIRIITTDRIMQVMADHPATARRAYSGPAPFTGQTIEEAQGVLTYDDVSTVFRKFRVQAPQTHDLRIQTKTGEMRAYPESNMTFIASTGRSEEVLYNVDDVDQVLMVRDTLGFNAIGTPNGQQNPGRKAATRAFTNQKDARIELEGWQATGPVIMEPTAIANIDEIDID